MGAILRRVFGAFAVTAFPREDAVRAVVSCVLRATAVTAFPRQYSMWTVFGRVLSAFAEAALPREDSVRAILTRMLRATAVIALSCENSHCVPNRVVMKSSVKVSLPLAMVIVHTATYAVVTGR